MPLNVQQNGSSAARRVLFILLLVVSVVMATMYGREDASGPLHAAQSAVMGATGQAAGVSAGVGAVTGSAAEALGDATADPTTLSGLREQNAELREMLAQAEEYRQEVDRLRELLDMKQASGVTGIAAHITGRSTNAWDQSITIDVGSLDGVLAGMTIMGSTGVIGQVAQTSSHTSTVRLLTDPNSGAAVMVQSSRANGIVRGSINGLLYLEDLDEGVVPEVGDVIITSGLGGSYQRGLIVGAVVNVNKTANNTAGTVIVSPNDSAKLLEEVIVVFKAPDAAAVDAAAARAAEEARQNQSESEEEYDDEEGE